MDEDRLSMRRASIGLGLAVAIFLTATTVHAGNPSVLNGVYRISWTEKELLTARTNHAYADGNRGVVIMTLRAGTFGLRWSPPTGPCRGRYVVAGKIFSIDFNVPTCPGGAGSFKATSSRHGNQLRFSRIRAADSGDEIFWGHKPWLKIG